MTQTEAAVKPTRRRKPKIAAPLPEPPKPPTCAQCGRELTWRDRLYVPAAAEGQQPCKTCHQRGAHKRLGVVAFHPATARVKQADGKLVEVLVRFNRAARRTRSAPPADVPRKRKPTRAERRAKARAATAVA